MTEPLFRCKVHIVATKYSLGVILNRPVGESVTDQLDVDGHQVNLTTVNFDDFVELTVAGEAALQDVCARCDAEVSLTVPFSNTVKVQAEATDDELEDGVVVLDRHSQIDLSQVVAEAIELARPSITYCEKHATSTAKPFVIE